MFEISVRFEYYGIETNMYIIYFFRLVISDQCHLRVIRMRIKLVTILSPIYFLLCLIYFPSLN